MVGTSIGVEVYLKLKHLYFHIPWCKKKCNYCSFYSKQIFDFEKYFELAKRNLKKFPNLSPKTVYFGGGTPSLLSSVQLSNLLGLLDLSSVSELTIECNPADVSLAYAKELKKIGFNRVSLGMQTFLETELKLLGRRASVEQNYKSFSYLRDAGFDNISCDLIYGLPNQSMSDLLFSLEKMIELRPEHISTYLLSLDEKVPLHSQKKNIPCDEELEKFYLKIREALLEAGYHQYELSNFCLPACESQHNLAYWHGKYYLGIGQGACSFYEEQGKLMRTDGFGGCEKITPEQEEAEFIFLSLRLTEGLNKRAYFEKFDADFEEKYSIILSKYRNYFDISEKRIALNSEAYFVSDEIFSEFITYE